MPVSKHRKRSKQNSFGIRKEQKRKDEAQERQRQYQISRQFRNEIEAYELEKSILKTIKQIQGVGK